MTAPEPRRRPGIRWLTLAEIVAIAAVVISALTLYSSWQDRRQERADKAVARAQEGAPAAFGLRATPASDGDTLGLAPVAEDQPIQAQTVRFPPALALAPVTTTGDARIEARWFADALKRARREAKLPDETAGDARMPVMIATEYLSGDRTLTARGYYDVGYVLEGHFLRGSSVRLRGLSRIGGAPAGDAAVDRRLSALWRSR